jgi:hypothetical protein
MSQFKEVQTFSFRLSKIHFDIAFSSRPMTTPIPAKQLLSLEVSKPTVYILAIRAILPAHLVLDFIITQKISAKNSKL